MRVTAFIVVVTLLLAIAVLVVPLVGEAQPATSLPRIGFLAPSSPSDPRVARYLQAFRQGLRDLGYVEGQNVAIEFRWAGAQYDRLPDLAAELVRLKVNVIVAGGPPAIQAAKHATETIPIVMAAVADPVATGFVSSLARPGGNITGISNMLPELIGKQLELLKKVLPKVSRVALLGNPANPNNAALVQQAQDAAGASGVRLQTLEARDPSEIDRAFTAIISERAGAVIVLTDTVLLDHRKRIADHAVGRRLPTVFGVSQVRRGRWAPDVRAEPRGWVLAGADLRGQDPQGGQAGRPPDRAAGDVRASGQPEDGEGAEADYPAGSASAGRPGHTVGHNS